MKANFLESENKGSTSPPLKTTPPRGVSPQPIKTKNIPHPPSINNSTNNLFSHIQRNNSFKGLYVCMYVRMNEGDYVLAFTQTIKTSPSN